MYVIKCVKCMNRGVLMMLVVIAICYDMKSQTKSNEWKLYKNKNNIKIYIKKHVDTGLKEVKGMMKMRTSLSAIISLLADIDNQKNWIYSNKESIMLKRYNRYHWVLQTLSDAPFPFTDRDLISETTMEQDSNLVISIKSNARPTFIKEDKNYVRIKYMVSSWRFTPKPDGIVIIEFKLRINLGGNLPIWITNIAVDIGPYNTLQSMRKQLERDKYRNAKISYIKE